MILKTDAELVDLRIEIATKMCQGFVASLGYGAFVARRSFLSGYILGRFF